VAEPERIAATTVSARALEEQVDEAAPSLPSRTLLLPS
jgi:hypothetical protein